MASTPSHTEQDGRRVTLVGAGVNLALIVFKFGAGFLGQSQALIADAVHSFSDLFTDVVVLFGIHMGRKPPDARHHFGHARIETLASAIVGLALVATGVFIGIEAVLAIYRHADYRPTWLAVAGAAVSILSKEVLYHYTVAVGRRMRSQLVIANAWHHRSDAFSSVAVLIGVGLAQVNPAWHILDAYAALLVSFFIVKVGIDITAKTFSEFTDRAPPPQVIEEMRRCTCAVPGVLEAHDLRARISGGSYQMEIHIVVDGALSVQEGHHIAKSVEQCLLDKVEDLERVIVHVDPAGSREETA